MRYFILSVFALFLLASCEKDIKVVVPPHESKLVVNSITMEGDTIEVMVGKSVGVNDYNYKRSQLITDANVVLTVDGVAQALTYDVISGTYRSKAVAEKGKAYLLKVSAKGYQDVEASTYVPALVSITSAGVINNARNTTSNGPQDELKLKFTDPAAASDYYVLRILPGQDYSIQDSIYGYQNYSYSTCVTSSDPSIEDQYGDPLSGDECMNSSEILFGDGLFNGKEKELKVYIYSGFFQSYAITANGDTLKPVVELWHISEGYYKYMKTVRYSMNNEGNPFAEPTSVYTNIKNGYGIFSMMSKDEQEVE